MEADTWVEMALTTALEFSVFVNGSRYLNRNDPNNGFGVACPQVIILDERVAFFIVSDGSRYLDGNDPNDCCGVQCLQGHLS